MEFKKSQRHFNILKSIPIWLLAIFQGLRPFVRVTKLLVCEVGWIFYDFCGSLAAFSDLRKILTQSIRLRV